MPNLLNSQTILIAITISVISSILYIREYFLRKKIAKQEQKTSIQTKQKSFQLLHAAEMAETQILADSKYSTQRLESEFKDQFNNLLAASEKNITDSQDTLIKFMADLQKRSQEFEEVSKKTAEERINKLFDKLEERLSDFLVTAEEKTTSSIELELKATRQMIDTYKEQQLKLIDENVLAMMEQTLSIVLAKKLSLKDQLDLIYEALEKAKVEKFIV